jgi:RNA polymerase sigma-70 factor (ECF subfamily)
MQSAMKTDANCYEPGYSSQGHAYSWAVRRDRMAALNQWLLENQRIVYNLAYLMLGDPDSAAAATERTFLKACRQRPRGQPSVRWLLPIAIAMCKEELCQAQMLTSDLCRPSVGDNAYESVTPHTAHQPAGDGVQTLLNTLPPDQRLTLVLSDVQGLSYRQIADVIGVSVDVVRSHLSRGRTALRNALLARGEISPGVQP